MAVQIVFLVFFGITNYNDNNNIKPLVVKFAASSLILDRKRRDSRR